MDEDQAEPLSYGYGCPQEQQRYEKWYADHLDPILERAGKKMGNRKIDYIDKRIRFVEGDILKEWVQVELEEDGDELKKWYDSAMGAWRHKSVFERESGMPSKIRNFLRTGFSL
jgi:hypothetical protein